MDLDIEGCVRLSLYVVLEKGDLLVLLLKLVLHFGDEFFSLLGAHVETV